MTLLLYGTLGSAHCEWSASSAPALQRYVDARCNDARCKGQQWCEMNGVLQQVDCCCCTAPDSSSRVTQVCRSRLPIIDHDRDRLWSITDHWSRIFKKPPRWSVNSILEMIGYSIIYDHFKMASKICRDSVRTPEIDFFLNFYCRSAD